MIRPIASVAGPVRSWAQGATHILAPFVTTFLDLAHPPMCLGCGNPLVLRRPADRPLCGPCPRTLPLIEDPCVRCSRLDHDPTLVPCLMCRKELPPVPLRYAGWHDHLLRDLVVGAKWHGRSATVPLLARWMASAARRQDWHLGLDLCCSVPRDPLRLLLRGRPLAETLGSQVGAILGLSPLTRLRRKRRPPQAKLTGRARRNNLRDALYIAARHRSQARGRSVIIIDDVVTTGSTLAACAEALFDCGAREVKALVATAKPVQN